MVLNVVLMTSSLRGIGTNVDLSASRPVSSAYCHAIEQMSSKGPENGRMGMSGCLCVGVRPCKALGSSCVIAAS